MKIVNSQNLPLIDILRTVLGKIQRYHAVLRILSLRPKDVFVIARLMDSPLDTSKDVSFLTKSDSASSCPLLVYSYMKCCSSTPFILLSVTFKVHCVWLHMIYTHIVGMYDILSLPVSVILIAFDASFTAHF